MSRYVKLVLTEAQMDALLTIAIEAEAGAYAEGEMFEQDTRRIKAAQAAVDQLRRVVQGIYKARGEI